MTTRVFQYLENMERIRAVGTPFHQHIYDAGCPWVEWSINERKLPGAHMQPQANVTVDVDAKRFEKFLADQLASPFENRSEEL